MGPSGITSPAYDARIDADFRRYMRFRGSSFKPLKSPLPAWF